MHITKIELEDIKSHASSRFEFERGTTAIIGENGAGKTTLIEAVAWTLFDLLDYKKDDFVRRGAKKGVAKVTFESGLDGRKYLVHRDTKTAYYVYDPRLKTRIADKKEEVMRFLWQHLGAEAGTDLESLFRRAIGVPQGTLTAIFLESPTERKRAFDKLLKVEEYRESSDKLIETARFVDGRIIEAREKIARSEGEVSRFEELEKDLEEQSKEVKALKESHLTLDKEFRDKKEKVSKFEETAAKIQSLQSSLEKAKSETARAEYVLVNAKSGKEQAEAASAKIRELEDEYQAHLKALGKLKEFERERIEREKFRTDLSKIETALVNVKAEQKAAEEDRKKIAEAHAEIRELESKAAAQTGLEQKQETLRNKIAEARSAENQFKSLDQKIVRLRERYRENQQLRSEAEEKSAEAKFLEERQNRADEIGKSLADLRAKLDSDERFQAEVKNNVCPILSEKCLNLKEGQTLEGFLKDQFSGARSKIEKLETEQKELAVSLQASRAAEKFGAQLQTLIKRESEIAAEGTSLKDEKESIKSSVRDLEKLSQELRTVEKELADLQNPKARIEILRRETTREISAREKITEIESNLERLESDRKLKVEQLETYKDLDSNWEEFSNLRDKTSAAHREYVANEAAARSLEEKNKALDSAQKEFETTEENLKAAAEELEKETKDFDSEKFALEKAELTAIERRSVEAKLNFEHANKRKDELESEIKRLEEIRNSLIGEFKEKDRLEKIRDITAFIRTTLKEAAPRVARNYVHHVSIEANQMFRDIMGNAERTLKWADDYGIVLEENGFERPFQNLSGGEQMVAALSVRLALLKQLSDIKMAFFDEPTMNMDAERREGLAEQISRITQNQTFDQLFVISHDDTFEGYVDNVVTVEAD
ncbi:MAG: SMC family ATPase [Pyrinomonadaceae bacterium]